MTTKKRGREARRRRWIVDATWSTASVCIIITRVTRTPPGPRAPRTATGRTRASCRHHAAAPPSLPCQEHPPSFFSFDLRHELRTTSLLLYVARIPPAAESTAAPPSLPCRRHRRSVPSSARRPPPRRYRRPDRRCRTSWSVTSASSRCFVWRPCRGHCTTSCATSTTAVPAAAGPRRPASTVHRYTVTITTSTRACCWAVPGPRHPTRSTTPSCRVPAASTRPPSSHSLPAETVRQAATSATTTFPVCTSHCYQ